MTQTRPWLCARYKDDEDWTWGGPDMEDAINAGLDAFGEDEEEGYDADGARIAGFWVAPSHKSRESNPDDCHPEEHEFTVESEHAQWIPIS